MTYTVVASKEPVIDGEWELIQTVNVTAGEKVAWMNGLNGNADIEYKIVAYLKVLSAGTERGGLLVFNGSGTDSNMGSASIYGVTNAGANYGELTGDLRVGRTPQQNCAFNSTTYLGSKSGKIRAFRSFASSTTNVNGYNTYNIVGGGWRNTSTNITSMGIQFDVTYTGRIYLYRRRH